jgi:hypothetical protein
MFEITIIIICLIINAVLAGSEAAFIAVNISFLRGVDAAFECSVFIKRYQDAHWGVFLGNQGIGIVTLESILKRLKLMSMMKTAMERSRNCLC